MEDLEKNNFLKEEEEEEEECTTWVKPKKNINSPIEDKLKNDGQESIINEEEKQPLLNHNNNENDNQQDKKTSKTGIIISFIILLGSIPALIGAWCWPALIIGLLSGVATGAARRMGHIISFSVTLGLMIAVNLYMLYCAIKKRKGYKYRYIPFCITVLAGCLIMADLLRHVLADYHIWKPGPFPGSSQYRPNCDKENISCLSFTGVLFTIIFTYTGFILLFIGTMWNANIIEKLKLIKKKWRQIRNQQKKTIN